jgi:hypothetical protein
VQHRLPTPLAQAFVVCREIYQDRRSNEFLLIRPFNRVAFRSFPARCPLAIYAHITGGHGHYQVELHLRDSEGRTVWARRWDEPLEHPDPVEPQQIAFWELVVDFPRTGRYDLVLVANGEDVASQGLWVRAQ